LRGLWKGVCIEIERFLVEGMVQNLGNIDVLCLFPIVVGVFLELANMQTSDPFYSMSCRAHASWTSFASQRRFGVFIYSYCFAGEQ
jgi:hypothetical protein